MREAALWPWDHVLHLEGTSTSTHSLRVLNTSNKATHHSNLQASIQELKTKKEIRKQDATLDIQCSSPKPNPKEQRGGKPKAPPPGLSEVLRL